MLLTLGDISVQTQFTSKQKSDILAKLAEKKSSSEGTISSDLAAFAPKAKNQTPSNVISAPTEGKYLMKMNLLANKTKIKPESVNKFFTSLSRTVNEPKLAEKVF